MISQRSIYSVAKNIREETLILLETTVPPGTTKKLFTLFLRKRSWRES